MLKNFIKKAKDKFGNKFDYTKFIYTNSKTKSIIICPTHGEFLQNPDKHLNSKYGCKSCWEVEKKKIKRDYVKGSDSLSKEDFLKRCFEKYKGKYGYDLSDYNGLTGNDIKVICPIHGEFKTKPHAHLLKNNKYGCSECANEFRSISKTQDYDNVIKDLKKIYDNKYKYPEYNRDNYINKRSKIDIICPIHGLYIKSVQKHKSGQHCFECTINKMVSDNVLVGGYSLDLFENKPELKDRKSILYYLKINNGEFYKIGITTVSTKSRIKSLKSKSKGFIKNVDIVFEKEMTLFESYKLEYKILNENKENRVYTKWSTEVFNEDVIKKPS